jgi:hypothetical protein
MIDLPSQPLGDIDPESQVSLPAPSIGEVPREGGGCTKFRLPRTLTRRQQLSRV